MRDRFQRGRNSLVREGHGNLDLAEPGEGQNSAVVRELFDLFRLVGNKLSELNGEEKYAENSIFFKNEPVDFQNWLRKAYKDRMLRKSVFDSDHLFGEPCWDILLDLAKSEMEGKRISITSACIASGVPSTTALRWISILEGEGLVEKELDFSDRRRSFVRISSLGLKLLAKYFKAITPLLHS